MPKRYEEEINEILHKFDDWPPPSNDRGRRPRSEPPKRNNRPVSHGSFFGGAGAHQLMLLGLLLILAGVVMRFTYRFGVIGGVTLGGYAVAIGFLVLLAGYIMAVAAGGGSNGLRRGQHMWRGQVVDLRPSSGGLAYWWWRFRANLRRH
jgi:hypothetical protein